MAMTGTGIVVLLTGLATGIFGWMVTSLSYDYYRGQQRALDIYVNVFIAWAVITTLTVFVLSVLGVYLLSSRRKWNASVAGIISTVVSVAATGLLHVGGLLVSSSVANWFRAT